MKILIIRNFPSYMSVIRNTYNIQEVGLAKALVRKGQDCDILFWTDKEEENITIDAGDNKSITVFYRRGITKLKNTVYDHCGELFEKYDILQPCEYNQIQSWILAKKFPEKTIIYHGPYYSKFNKNYNRMCKVFDMFFKKSYVRLDTPFIVKSHLSREFMLSKGISPENITMAGVGVDTQMLISDHEQCTEPLYKDISENKSDIKLLYIGRLEPRRNIRFIFETFSLLHKKFPATKLYMIGTGEREYVSRVFDFAKQAGIMEHIVWQEKMEQKYLSSIYSQADYFILPTEYEIFGMVLLEAMYFNTVVFTTRNGGSSVLINNRENGFIMERLDPSEWANMIADCINHPDMAKRVACRASETISSNFTWDRLSDKFIAAYQMLLNNK